jgi:hypothetical protein
MVVRTNVLLSPALTNKWPSREPRQVTGQMRVHNRTVTLGELPMNREWVPNRRAEELSRPARRTGALIVLGICDIVWLWKATP